MDNYWIKIKQEFLYKLEKIFNWATYLKHLQVVLTKFNPIIAFNEDILIWYFQKDLKSSIWA